MEVTWYGAVAFCNWLSEKEGLKKAYNTDLELKNHIVNLGGYRLPSEKEWEYTARGGVKGDTTTYTGSDNIDDVAWYDSNSNEIHQVGEKQTNELGIYDMSGNVYEWTNTPDGSCRVRG